jgi:hypothetical protein
MADAKKVTLEYIGLSGEIAFDEDDNKQVSLVAGRRYQMSEALAAYRLEHDATYWQRPVSKTAAVKE